jgi:hypothetical protein
MQLTIQKKAKYHQDLMIDINCIPELLATDIEIENLPHLSYQNGIKDQDIK